MKPFGKTLVIFVMLFGLSSKAVILKFEKSQGEVTFLAIGKPGFLKVNGKGAGAQGSLSIEKAVAKGEFQFELESLDTGIGLRNTHMKEKYLEIGKYPTATLKISDLKVADFDGEKAEIKDQPFKGTLKLHDVENEVTGIFSAKKNGNEVTGTAEFEIPLPKYKIDIPSYAGITVAENVKIKIEFAPKADSKEVTKQ